MSISDFLFSAYRPPFLASYWVPLKKFTLHVYVLKILSTCDAHVCFCVAQKHKLY